MNKNIYGSFVKMSIFVTISISSLSAMNFHSYKHGIYNFIYATGKIKSRDINKLSRIYKKLPQNKQTVVVFNSSGGEMSTGIQIGSFLKKHRIGSAVVQNGMCASSCALAFLGGRDRYGRKLMILPYNAKLGYHSFYYENKNLVNSNKVQRDLSYLMKYFNYVHAPTSLITKMLDTDSSHMYWITRYNNRYLSLKSGLRGYSFAKSSKKRYYSINTHSKTAYIKDYFSAVNMVIKANKGYRSSYNVALNSKSYNNWLTNNLRYAYINSMQVAKDNIVKIKATYMLSNGQRACTYNSYKLKPTYNSWKIEYKKITPCNKHSKKVLKNIKNELP